MLFLKNFIYKERKFYKQFLKIKNKNLNTKLHNHGKLQKKTNLSELILRHFVFSDIHYIILC